jgi:hypothetical protein
MLEALQSTQLAASTTAKIVVAAMMAGEHALKC